MTDCVSEPNVWLKLRLQCIYIDLSHSTLTDNSFGHSPWVWLYQSALPSCKCLSKLDRHKFIIRRLTQIEYIDSFHSVHYFCRYTFQAENGMRFRSTNPLLRSFPLTHTKRTHWLFRVVLGFAYRENSGPRVCGAPSAEPYCACLFNCFSLDIRWPCHFTFLSSFMMNEVSGARCFLESSSKTAEAGASIQQ